MLFETTPELTHRAAIIHSLTQVYGAENFATLADMSNSELEAFRGVIFDDLAATLDDDDQADIPSAEGEDS